MSTNNSDVKVKMVRIKNLNKNDPVTYDNEVTVGILNDIQRNMEYLRISAEGKSVFRQDLRALKWLSKSSTDAVAAISSITANVIIVYDAHDESIFNFFVRLQVSLGHDPKSASSDSILSQIDQDQLDSTVDNLIRSINTGSLIDAEHSVRHLATVRANVQFNMISKNDDRDKNMTTSTSEVINTGSPDSVLQLTLRIECLMNTDPITAPITVRCGTTLQELKKQIENETGIQCTDQYWFVADRYPISDEYIFRSSISDVSNQQQSLVNAIRSGDTVIMYITQISPLHYTF